MSVLWLRIRALEHTTPLEALPSGLSSLWTSASVELEPVADDVRYVYEFVCRIDLYSLFVRLRKFAVNLFMEGMCDRVTLQAQLPQ